MGDTWYDLLREVGFSGAQQAPPRPPRRQVQFPFQQELGTLEQRYGDVRAPMIAPSPEGDGTQPGDRYHRPRNMPQIGREAMAPPRVTPTREEQIVSQMQREQRVQRYGQAGSDILDAAEGLAMSEPMELTGLPSVRRAAEGFTQGIRSGDPGDPGWAQGWGNGALAALQFATPEMLGIRGGRLPPRPERSPFRFDAPPPRIEEPVTPIPVNPTREIGAGGLPIRPRQPFRQSLVGGSDDLAEAAARRSAQPDAGSGRTGSVQEPNALPDGGSAGSGIPADAMPALRRELREHDFPLPSADVRLPRLSVPLADLRPTAPRGRGIDASVAQEYAGRETPLPPILVRREGRGWHVIDGNHRIEAARQRGLAEIEVQDASDLFSSNAGNKGGSDPPPRPPLRRR